MYMGAYMRRVFVSVHFGVVSASVSISEGLCTQVWLCLHAYMNVYTYLAQCDTCSCLENKGQTRIERNCCSRDSRNYLEELVALSQNPAINSANDKLD